MHLTLETEVAGNGRVPATSKSSTSGIFESFDKQQHLARKYQFRFSACALQNLPFLLHTCHLQCTSTSSKSIAFRAERLAVARPAKHFLFYGETTAPDVRGPDLFAILESFIAQVCTIQRLKRVTKVATLHTESD